jgi:mRNA interferase RelE/StbE
VPYQIEYLKRAEKDIAGLDRVQQEKIIDAIEALARNPRPPGVTAMQGKYKGHYRVRVGDYRIIYEVKDSVLVVQVVRVGHRKEIYR